MQESDFRSLADPADEILVQLEPSFVQLADRLVIADRPAERAERDD